MIKEKTITVLEVDWVALSTAVEKLVMEKMTEDLERWKDDERSMRAMVLGNASDGLDVCDVLATGDWQKVINRLWDMDTAARDEVYEMIQMAGGDLFVKHYMKGN